MKTVYPPTNTVCGGGGGGGGYNNVSKIYFDYVSHTDCKIEYSKTLSVFLCAPVIATCGY